MNIVIREALEADLPLLARMNKCLIEDEVSRNPMNLAELQERMAGWFNKDWQIRLFVDGESQAVVGYAVYQPRQDEYEPGHQMVYLRQMYVERAVRSRGIGQQALDLLVETCFPAGCTVVIDVLASNPRGYNFWRKTGFVPYCTTMHLKK